MSKNSKKSCCLWSRHAAFRIGHLTLQACLLVLSLLAGDIVLAQTTQYWDGVDTTANGAINIGNGTWNLSNTNWTNSAGSVNSAWVNGSFAQINGNSYIEITVTEPVQIAGMNSVANYLTFSGTGTGSLELVANPTVLNSNANGNFSNVFNIPLTGSVGNAVTFRGATFLKAANTFLGNIVLTSGYITLNSSGSLGNGSYAGNISGSGGFYHSTGVNQTLSGVISGALSFFKNAASSTLTLSGNNTYTGTTTIDSGKLLINGNQSSATGAITITNATLGGTGTIGGAVTVQSGGILAPGTSPGTLTVASLTLSSGSTTSYELGQAGTVGGTCNDLTTVDGNLTLGGTLTVTNANGSGSCTSAFGAGTYRLFNYTGTLSGSFSSISLPAGYGGLIDTTTTTGQVNLIVVSSSTLTFWDVAPQNNNAVDGGTGIWNSSNSNWTDSGGAFSGIWPGTTSTATFAGTAGPFTVTVSGNQSIGGLTFNTTGYTLSGGTLTGAATTNALTIASGTATISSVLSGSNAFTKEGAGTLTLSGANTYTGATTVSAGTLALSDNGFSSGLIGATSVASGATLSFISTTNRFNTPRTTTITLASGAALTNQNPTNWTVLGNPIAVSGTTTITTTHNATTTGDRGFYPDGGITGSGALTINSANAGSCVNFRNTNNSFTGTLVVNGISSTTAFADSGICVSGAGTTLATADITLNGTMQLRNGSSGWSTANSTAQTVSIGALGGSGTVIGHASASGSAALTVGSTNNSATFSGVIANGTNNTTSLIKAGTGTQTLSGANTYTGATTVSAGILAISSTTTTSGITVSSGASVQGATTSTVPLTVSGAGIAAANGALLLGSLQTWSGNILLAANASLYQLLSIGTLSGTINNQGNTLTLGGAASTTLIANGIISGTGALTKTGSGNTATLNAVNTYGGNTTVSAGTLQLGTNSALPTASATTVASGATLSINGKTQTLSAGLTSSGTVDLGTNGSLTLSGGSSSIGTITGSGTITVNTGASLTLTSALVNTNVNIVLAGGTLNLGNFTTHSIGTLSLTANSTLDFSSSGNAQITAATLTPSTFTLAATNWAAGSDHFYATAVTGTPAKNTTGLTPLNQITLGSNAASTTYWSTVANELLAAGNLTYWDGSATDTTTVEGGLGFWNATSTNWTTSTGTPNGIWAGGSTTAIFTGTANTVTVSGNQNMGGLTFNTTGYTLNNGTLTGTATTNALTIASGTATISSVLAGGSTNSFDKQGAGTLTLSGANTYTGATNVTGGTLALGNSGQISLAGGNPLIVGAGGAGTSGSFQISNTATLNAGYLYIGNLASSTGAFTQSAGTVQMNATANDNRVGGGSSTGTGTYNMSGGTLVTNGNFQVGAYGTGIFNQTGGSATINDYLAIGRFSGGIGNWNISAGSLSTNNRVLIVGELGTGALNISGTGLVTASQGISMAHNNGTGTLNLDGGTLETTTIYKNALGSAIFNFNGGTLKALNNQSAFIASSMDRVNIRNGGAFINNNSFDIIIPAPILHSNVGGDATTDGGLTKNGAGTLTLSAINTYTGTTTVSAGKLFINGNQSTATGAVTVASGATLGGSGTIGGAVTIQNGGILAPGNSPGTLTVASLTLNSTSVLNYELGQAGTAGGSLNDLTQDNGALTLDGIINISQSAGGSFTPGVYRLINYNTGSTFTNNTLNIGTVPSGVTASDLRIDTTSVAGQVNLVYAGSGYTYWDVSPQNNSVVNGGTGTWQSSVGNTNWTLSSGASNATWYDGGTAIFAGTAGPFTVTVSNILGAINIGGLTFNTTGYTLQSGTLTGAATTNALTIASGTATISSVLSGSNAFTKEGAGILTLSGVNTYTGTTTVSAGTLAISSSGTLYNFTGAGNVIVNSGGTLRFDRNDTWGNVLSTPAATVTINSGGVLASNNTFNTLNNPVFNDGTLTANGGTTSFFGAFALKGTVTSTGTSTFGVGTGSNNQLNIGSNVAGGTTTFNVTSGMLSIANILADSNSNSSGAPVSGGLTKTGSGTMTLSGTNTYTGVTTVSAGTLAITNNSALGTTAGGTTVASGATLALSNNISVGAEPTTISGTGVSSAGALSNTSGTNTYGGAITLGAASTIGSAAGALTLSSTINNATFGLTLDGAGNITANGIISGTGALTKTGSGIAALNIANTYGGSTTVSAGTLQLGINSALPTASATTVASGATLSINGKTQTLSAGLTSSGTVDLGTSGSLTLSGGSSSIGAITGSGTITVNTGASLTLTSALVNTNVNIVLAGGTLNLGNFTTHSIGTLSLTANSTLDFSSSGNAQITAATLTPSTFTLAATNWTIGSDHFYATAITGAPAKNSIGSPPLHQISLGSNPSYKTVWLTSTEIHLVTTVSIAKTANGGGGTFTFTLTGLSSSGDSITVASANSTVTSSDVKIGTANTAVTLTESTVPSGWPANPTSASCTDANSAFTGNPASFGLLTANQLSIAGANLKAGANITCTFVNTYTATTTLGGTIFNDNGNGSGTANDGIQNGTEARLASQPVNLTDCGSTVLANTLTDSNGSYTLTVPNGTANGASLCIAQTNQNGWLSTGASKGSIALPSDTPTSVSSQTYTYTRSSTPDTIALTWSGSSQSGFNFGDIAADTLAAGQNTALAAGGIARSPHSYTPHSPSTVTFAITDTATPTATWNHVLYKDTNCNNIIDNGETLLTNPLTVTAGDVDTPICILIVSNAPLGLNDGANDQIQLTATAQYSGATPLLTHLLSATDTLTISNQSLLQLSKQVCNRTTNVNQCANASDFGNTNTAKTGDIIDYRITYTNNTAESIHTIQINDTTPAYTTFQAATADTLPASITACNKTTPANPSGPAVDCNLPQSTGGTGDISWIFTGTLEAGQSSYVSFSIQVN